jgi:PRTase ComF-like
VRRRVVTAFDLDSSGPDRPPLDLAEFSRFKHGAAPPAWRFGRHLVRRMVADCADVVHAERLVVTASCYKVVPLASVALGRVVAHCLNRNRTDAGLAPVTWTQFYRDQLIEGDYSTMSLAQRREFIAGDVIRVDAAVLSGAAVLVVDDMRVTGFHEGRLASVLETAGAPAATFAYLVAIDGRDDPTVEQRLNQTTVDGVDALLALVRSSGFILNSRVCKLILGAPLDEAGRLVDNLPAWLLGELVAGLECNGYAVMARYRPAYELMLAAVDRRRTA